MPSHDPAELLRRYEGAARLGQLLQAAGATLSVEEVKAQLAEALAEGVPASEVFPELFEGEPRFPSPQVAQALYGNLFGLWDRLAKGQADEPGPERAEGPRAERVEVAAPEPIPPPPTLGAAPDDVFVEAAFRHLASLSERDRQRRRDRFEQRESDVMQSIATLALSPAAEEAGVEMAFELWMISELALGEKKVGRTDFSGLRAGVAGTPNPALCRYLEEWLGEAMLDEQEPLTAEERAKLEPMLRGAIVQLAG